MTSDDITSIYEAHATQMVATAAMATFDSQAALDIVGEAFARAFEQRDRFVGHPADAGRAWIAGIVANLVRDYMRSGGIERRAMTRLQIERQIPTAVDTARIERLAGLEELRKHLSAALGSISEGNRRAVQLRVIHEMEYADIATELGVSAGTARARVSRGLRELRGVLERQGMKFEEGAIVHG